MGAEAKVEQRFIDWKLLAQKWLHSRKVLLYIFLIIIGTIGLFMKLLDGGQWVDLVKWATAGYMIGNAGEHIADGINQCGGGDDSGKS